MVIVYYILENGQMRTYNGTTLNNADKFCCRDNDDNFIGNFGMNTKVYDESDEGLKQYYIDFTQWSDELKDKNYICKFDYASKKSHSYAAYHFFLKYCKESIFKFPSIKKIESSYIEKCYNGGLMFCDPNTEFKQVYSYDRNNFYPHVLGCESSEFYFPNSKGHEIKLTELPSIDDLLFGIYHVNMSSDNQNASKIFAFNYDENMYTHYDLKFAMTHQKQFNFKIELIYDNEPNAYIYESIIKSSDIFSKWYDVLTRLRAKFPKNKLIKSLGSSCWGVLSAHNSITITDEKLISNAEEYSNYEILKTIIHGEQGEENYRMFHYIFNTDKPYKYNMRLKGWLNSYCRNRIAEFAMIDIDSVIRIHTDSVSFRKKQEVDNKLFKLEDKTTGLIKFKNVNNYHHICNKYKCPMNQEPMKYDEYIKHTCHDDRSEHIVKCTACNFECKRKNMKNHEKSLKHINNLKML